MKFDRKPRYERITIEGRKAAAFLRRQARELEKYPLLAGEIAETLPSMEEAEANRNASAARSEMRMRDLHARHWKEARRTYFASDKTTQKAIRAMWDGWTGPRRPSYFCYVVDFCTGEYERRAAESKDRHREVRDTIRRKMGLQMSLDAI